MVNETPGPEAEVPKFEGDPIAASDKMVKAQPRKAAKERKGK